MLGVDGGNTKTVALVARGDGEVLGAGRAGCADIYGAASADAALDALADAASGALEAAGASAEDLDCALVSVAGADWPEDFALYRAGLAARLGIEQRLEVINDALGALASGAPGDGTGVSVVCGTGLAVGARGRAGELWHASFWLQDDGGAWHLGRRALRAVWRAALDLDPPTALEPALLELYAERDAEALLHRFTRRGQPATERDAGRAAPVVLDCAEAGDAVARRIVADTGARIGDYAATAARRTGLAAEAFPLVLTGSVLTHPSPLLGDAIIAATRTLAPGAEPLRPVLPPVVGAVLLALAGAGVAPGEALRRRLAAAVLDVELARPRRH